MYSKRVTPLPELILAGKWQKREGQAAFVSIKDKVIQIPLDVSASSTAIRAHEDLHIKWSPKEKPRGNKMFQSALGAFEDERVNLLGFQHQDVDISAAPENLTLNNFYRIREPFLLACLYVSGRQYKPIPGLDDHIRNRVGNYMQVVEELIERLHLKPTFKTAVECSNELVELFLQPPPPPSPPTSQLSEPEPEMTDEELKAFKAEKKNEIQKALKGTDPSLGNVAREQAIEKNNKEDLRGMPEGFKKLERPTVEAGELIVVKPKLENFRRVHGKITTNRKASDFGTAIFYPERGLTDKFIFAGHKRQKAGTILVDCSGSMGIDTELLKKIVIDSSGVKVAGYYANDARYTDNVAKGRLVLLADHQRVLNEMDIPRRRCNVVDLPAVKWLCKQKAPRIWVSDGLMTGIGHFWSHNMRREVFNLVRKHNIKWIKSLRELKRHLKIK